jgi:hypothetical protein
MGCLRLNLLEHDCKSCEQKIFAVKNTLTFAKSEKKARSAYLYGFNGQEKEPEINPSITSAEFWMYDGRLGRRWNQDPKPLPWQSSYACFENNPIWYNDIKGDSAFQFDDKGYYMGIADDGKTEWSIQTMKMEQVTTSDGYLESKFVVDKTYSFNDPDKDVSDMKYLTEKYANSVPLLFVKTSDDLGQYVNQSGVLTKEAQDNPFGYAYSQSKQGGKMDNWAQYLGLEMASMGISVDDIQADKGAFFVYQGVNKAYNAMDFGNALWGLEMNKLGFTEFAAKAGAHGHHFFIARREHQQGGLLDAPGDQQAIDDGYNKFRSSVSVGAKVVW